MSTRISRSGLETISPRGVAIGQALDGGPVRAFGQFLDGEVIFVAGDEIELGAGLHAFIRLDRDLGADEADLGGGIDGADHGARSCSPT